MNRLLVPIPIKAFVTNGKNKEKNRIAQIVPNFDLINTEILGKNLENLPFTSKESMKKGVHLHFILPDALLHATQDEKTGEFNYRCIPNRWIVTRMVNDGEISINSWVIESDYLGDDNDESIVFPVMQADGNMVAKFLGRSYPLDEPADAGEYLKDLNATGWGDPSFAASYQHCRSVLGFYDDLEGVAIGSTLCYSVMGYYHNLDNDPMHGLKSLYEYQSRLEDFEWSTKDMNVLPHGLICHGLVYHITWDGTDAEYKDAQPAKGVEIAVGNSSQEAFAALLAKKMGGEQEAPQHTERFLNALQCHILADANEVDGIFKIQDYLHKKSFSVDDTDLKWIVRRTDQKADKTMAQPAGFAGDLDELNQNQYALDKTQREVNSLKETMYALWFQFTNLYEPCDLSGSVGTGDDDSDIEEGGPGDGPIIDDDFIAREEENPLKKPSEDYDYTHDSGMPGKTQPDITKCEDYKKLIEDIAGKIDALMKSADQYRKNISYEQNVIRNKIQEASGYYRLESIPREYFYRPADPVCLLSGEGVGRDYLFGQDGRLSDSKTLPCRSSPISELVGSNSRKIEKEQILECFSAYDYVNEKPDFYDDLLCEALCINPDTLVFLRSEFRDNSLTAKGNIPFETSVSNWEQPWNTLYLEWNVSYFAVNDVSDPTEAMKSWTLDDIDYETGDKGLELSKYIYSGRSILLPHSVELFSETIKNYSEQLEDDPDTKSFLEEVSAQITDVPVLSQILTGFHDALLGRQWALTFPPQNTKFHQEWNLAGIIRNYIDTQSYAPLPEKKFIPIRGGYLEINNINLISSFGHIHNIAQDFGQLTLSEQYMPEVEGYKERYPMLRSRINQALRLDFNWISRDMGINSNEDLSTSCICGYFLPNQLDNSLMVYDVDGVYKGSVKYVLRDGGSFARWNSNPKERLKHFNELTFTNDDLKNFIKSLLAHTENTKDVFSQILNLMDIRQGSCYSTGSHDTSIIWGKPFVLVKAAIQFELAGYPTTSWYRDELLDFTTKHFELLRPAVRIGDAKRAVDGVFGYFVGKDRRMNYDKLFLANGLKGKKALSGYLQFEEDISLPLKSDQRTYLSLLMNPDAALTLRTGLLPCQQHRIPPEFIRHSIRDLEMFFEVNSIVSQENEISIPMRKEDGFTWSFLHRNDTGINCKEFKEIIPPANVFAKDRSILIDGFLQTQKGE